MKEYLLFALFVCFVANCSVLIPCRRELILLQKVWNGPGNNVFYGLGVFLSIIPVEATPRNW